MACGRDIALQLEVVVPTVGEAVTLICSTLAEEESFRFTPQRDDSAWETHKSIARELKMHLPNLQLVLPDVQLLAKVCRTNPAASLAEVTQSIVIPAPRTVSEQLARTEDDRGLYLKTIEDILIGATQLDMLFLIIVVERTGNGSPDDAGVTSVEQVDTC